MKLLKVSSHNLLLKAFESGVKITIKRRPFTVIKMTIIIMIIIIIIIIIIINKVSERATMTEIQKISMLGSARILRKVLSV